MPKIRDTAHSDADIMRYDIYPSSLGLALIAASAKGVCAIMLGDDRGAMQKEFEQRFPNATVKPQNMSGRELAVRVLAVIAAEKIEIPPLDIRGTEFQKRVWRALIEIPAGSTISYKELASRVEAPTAIRAVAGACGSNPLAVVVPCHRVVRHDGTLSGYRWGIARKQVLLERESSSAYGPKGIRPRFAPGMS